jgi:DNA gyrase/topoisomerase IV subunit B
MSTNKVQYEKKTLQEQILLRPDTYIGNIRKMKTSEPIYTFEDDFKDGKMVKREVNYSDGMLRLFIEIVSNSIDNVWRSHEEKITTKFIQITANEKTGEFSVWNDGKNIPTGIHPTEKVHIPEMIFGQFLTSSNYNDGEERRTSGKNGLGSKACCLFSKSFEIEIYNKEEKKIYKQKWTDNMSTKTEPEIITKNFPKTVEEGKNGYTLVKWTPDYKRFGYNKEKPDEDFMGQIKKCVLDCALTVSFYKTIVMYNGKVVPVSKIEDYIKFYKLNGDTSDTSVNSSVNSSKITSPNVSDSESESEDEDENEDEVKVKMPKNEQLMVHDSTDCKVFIARSDEYTHISFVNGIFTKDGGIHVDTWSEAIFRPILAKLNSSKKKDKIDIRDIKKHFFIFVFCTLDKPTFDSQSKTRLNGPEMKAEMKEAVLKKIMKWSFVKKIEESMKLKEMLTLKKTTERKKGTTRIEGLDDAKYAGKKPEQCTLAICEGASAKTYIVQGMKYGFNINGEKKCGRDWIGVLPIRGKFLNARNASAKMLAGNKEVIALIQSLGLQYGLDYTQEENRKKLRYHKLMCACDADSVTKDTPLLLRKNGLFEVKTIDDIATTEWTNGENGKQYAMTDYETWTENGWTKIKHIMRHKTEKTIFRVLTHTGVVDVTEDHSLLQENGEKIEPTNIKINDTLLHSFPKFKKTLDNIKIDELNRKELDEIAKEHNIYRYGDMNKEKLKSKINIIKYEEQNSLFSEIQNSTISDDLSWLMGFFWADGTCGIYDYQLRRKPKNRPNEYTFNRHQASWAISNTNKEYLEKSLAICKKEYPEHNFCIIEDRHNSKTRENCKDAYKLILNGGIKAEPLIKQWREMFYDKDKNKIIPSSILNAKHSIRNNFLQGYLYGDGNKESDGVTLKTTEIKFDAHSKITGQCLFLLCKSLGYRVSINKGNRQPKVYSYNITKGTMQDNPIRIKKIFNLGTQDDYVYDLETENHHFQAGIGQMIVHNTDGLHITGLLYNFLHALFPTVLQIPGFFNFMRVPIVKISYKNKELSFFHYKQAIDYIEKNNIKKDNIRYFKGLGTATNKDIKDDFGKRIVYLNYTDSGNQLVDNVFNKTKSEFRKQWLTTYKPKESYPEIKDYELENESINEFINYELIQFSLEDCKRSIPSLADGFKESYRKILYAAFKRNLKYSGKSLKVAQFAGYVAEHTNYHHGEMNLFETITKMAQRFVGSNNIPLLFNDGQFGSRLVSSGKDAANGRYIFTKLDEFTRLIFREEDDDYLPNREDDGDIVEKEYYMPIIPTVLVNPTTAGIGTGWSCNIPAYNPKDLIAFIKKWLSNRDKEEKEYDQIKPWYKGFKGIIDVKDNTVTTYGVLAKVKQNVYRITEIPIGRKMYSIERYKEKLEDLKEEGVIKEIVSDDHTDEIVDFTVKCEKEPDHKSLGLIDTMQLTNMVLFDKNGKLKRYKSIYDILEEYCTQRYEFYSIRKKGEIKKMEHHIRVLKNKIQFINDVVTRKLDLLTNEDDDVKKYLEKNKFDLVEESYDYLLSIQVRGMTKTKLENLREQLAESIKALEKYKKLTEEQIWLTELKELENKLN